MDLPVWQALRDELHPHGLEIVTVGLDARGADGCRAFIEAASPAHPSLLDIHHLSSELFGFVQIPESVWVDEDGMIVRPAETAPAPPHERPAGGGLLGGEMPQRMLEIGAEAMGIETQPEDYHAALRDWVANGADSPFALSADEVVARTRPRTVETSTAHAHFDIATELEIRGDHQGAVRHFREAHRLMPDSWTFRRQAWSLEPGPDGPLARFWQGPPADDPDSWPYEGDWLSDIRETGPANYYASWEA